MHSIGRWFNGRCRWFTFEKNKTFDKIFPIYLSNQIGLNFKMKLTADDMQGNGSRCTIAGIAWIIARMKFPCGFNQQRSNLNTQTKSKHFNELVSFVIESQTIVLLRLVFFLSTKILPNFAVDVYHPAAIGLDRWAHIWRHRCYFSNCLI